MTTSTAATSLTADESYAAVQQACLDRGLTVGKLADRLNGWLGVHIKGSNQLWQLDVDYSSSSLTELPSIALRPPFKLLAHVNYQGIICVSDNQGLSLDSDRHPEIVAFTVLAAFDLLEKWDIKANAISDEFYNELEGYWSSLPRDTKARSTIEPDGKDRLINAYLDKKTSTHK